MSVRDPIDERRWIPFINASGVEIPARSIIQITGTQLYVIGGVGGETIEALTGNIPASSATANNIAITGRHSTPAGRPGDCTRLSPAVVRYTGSPAVNGSLGPQNGLLTAQAGQEGLVFHGVVPGVAGLALVSFSAGEAVQWSLVAKVRSGGIPALNTGTNAPGSSTVDLYAVNEAVSPAVMLNLSTFVIAYNVSDTAIPEGKFVPLTREPTSGVWIAVFGGTGGGEAIIVKTSPGAPILARFGTSLVGRSQSCEVFTVESDALVATGTFETIYNVESSPVPADEYFVAVKNRDSGLWIAVVPVGFDRCKGLALASFATTDGSFQVDNVKVTRGRNPLSDPSSTTETVAVNNEMEFEGDTDALVYFEWHQEAEAWYAYQVKCPQ